MPSIVAAFAGNAKTSELDLSHATCDNISDKQHMCRSSPCPRNKCTHPTHTAWIVLKTRCQVVLDTCK